MESINILPANKQLKAKAAALKLINDFAVLGFDTRATFLVIVTFYFPIYKTVREKNRLSNWWYLKLSDKTIFNDVSTTLNKLKK